MRRRSHSFSTEFDAENKILRLSVHGDVTDQLLLDGHAFLEACCARLGPCHCIVDYTAAGKIKISSAGIRHLASKPPIFPMDCLVLNVAPDNVMFGMARMFQSMSETRTNFRVVRTIQEALDLINVESPNFSPVEIELDLAA
jgi:hypothetical protein